VTMPNGEKAMQVDLKGTPMEGHEEAFMKQFVELERKFQARQAGPSSRGGGIWKVTGGEKTEDADDGRSYTYIHTIRRIAR
jgi:hypothetical protein